MGKRAPKRDHFGLFLKIEHACLETLELAITAALENRENKSAVLKLLKIKIEVIKHLVRTTLELNMIENKKYLNLAGQLQEISRMTNGWLRYLKN